MKYYILKYYLVNDYLERRTIYRGEGELLFGGTLIDPIDEALLVFCVEDKSLIEDFVNKDPYVKNGLVIKWEIREWIVVIF